MAEATVRELTINVDVEASVMLPPERASVLRVKVQRRSTDEDECTNDAITAARRVEAILRKSHHERTLDYWSRDSPSQETCDSYMTAKNPEPETQYTSRVNFTMHVQQFRCLSPLIAELVAIEHVHSEGVQWILTPQTQEAQHSQLRVQAAEDARRNGGDYAKALGYSEIWAVEVGNSTSYAQPTTMKGQVISRPASTAAKTAVKTTPGNLGEEEWVDAGEEAFWRRFSIVLRM